MKEIDMDKPNFELLKEAYAIIGGIPDEAIDLADIVTKNHGVSCNTIACAAGWLGLHPMFNALGLQTQFSTVSTGGWLTKQGIASNSFIVILASLFNIEELDAYKLFDQRGYEEQPTFSDKEVFLNRVREFLKKHGQLSWQLAGEKDPCSS